MATDPQAPKKRRVAGGSLASRKKQTPVKLLLVGANGTGKTGALASLVRAGYNLRVMDFDNGLDILVDLLTEKDPALLEKVRYRTFADKLKKTGGAMLPVGVPTAFSNAMAMLDNWQDGEGVLGPVSSWTINDVLVLDSLTFAAKAAMRLHLVSNGRAASKPWLSDFGDVQVQLEAMLSYLFAPYVKCNVVVITHIIYVDQKGPDGVEQTMAYPSSIGKALGPTIGSYFNTMLEARVTGAETKARRVLLTQPRGILAGVKCSAPKSVKAELPQATGLAEFFRAVQTAPEGLVPIAPEPSELPREEPTNA